MLCEGIKHPNPVQNCQIHSHIECHSREVNPLWQIRQQLMIEGLYPVGVTTLEQ